jgi:hypothetical protein
MAKKLRMVSWIILTLFGVLLLLGAVGSAVTAMTRGPDQFGTMTMDELTAGNDEVIGILYARRLTAAAYASGFAVLFLLIVLIPYRRGEIWAWWALLFATCVTAGLYILRVPTIGVTIGSEIGYLMLGFVVVALLLDVSRLRKSS